MRHYIRAASLLVVLAVLAACSSSSSSSSGSGGSSPASPSASASSPVITGTGTGIKTASTSVGTVLTTTDGLTMYWFVPDTATKSNCNGSCATYWPPVKGPVSAASGVSLPDKFGTITRSDGTKQATYDGHPLYTYSGDPGPGQVTGNALKASGGLWYAMTPNGAKPSASASPSKSSGGGY